MADTHHAPHDPNAAPMHQDVVEDFSGVHVFIAIFLGLAATAAGLICGLLIVND